MLDQILSALLTSGRGCFFGFGRGEFFLGRAEANALRTPLLAVAASLALGVTNSSWGSVA